MGTLVFQANLGGAVNLIGPNTASTVNFTLPSADGTSGQALVTNGSGTLSFSTFTSGAAGSNTQVQFNSSGAFAGSANLTFDGTTLTSNALTVTNATTLSAGTANGVAYLNGSKVVTTGSALTFDGTTLKAAQGSSGATAASNGNTLVLENSAAVGMSLLSPDANASRIYFGTASNNRNAFIYSDYNAGAQTLIFGLGSGATAATEQMRLTSTGRLGLGLTSPSTLFEAYGGAAGTSSELTVGNASTAARFGVDTSNEVTVATGQAVPIKFLTSNTERARIDSSGNLLVGTTSVLNSGKFSLYQTNNSFAAVVQNTSSGVSGAYGIQVNLTQDPNTTDSFFYKGTGNATDRFYVRANGGIGNYQANDVNLSDRREKTNFAPAGEYLSKICAIPVQTYKYIDQTDDELTLGVVAQDVQAVAPELVTESNWGTTEEPKMRLSIYQTDLQYALMKCIQEQQALITQLTERITALEFK